MIFLTVGTQLPFDRLVRAVDSWVASNGRTDVFGQIAHPGPGGYRPRNFPYTEHIAPAEFERRCRHASLIVAHAGMGSLITALTVARPIVVMPRLARLGEHRNDHQSATAARLGDRAGVFVALDEVALPDALDSACDDGGTGGGSSLRPFADESLIAAVRAAVLGD